VEALAAPNPVQIVLVGQETAFRTLNWPPGRSRECWIVHALPFQRSASVTASDCPTAVHADVVGQDTP